MTLQEFLVKAKAAGYATAGERLEIVRPDGGKELSYREGSFEYLDRYYGFNPFAGTEVVWSHGAVAWMMSYYGAVTDASISPIAVYRFLQEAMTGVSEDRPFRGPKRFVSGEYEYRDESQGDVESFTGIERIFLAGCEVYCLKYHGGLVRGGE